MKDGVCRDLLSSSAEDPGRCSAVELEEARVMIVMGLDQHRGQVTAAWIDTGIGEGSRARIAPGHREPVARFMARFGGSDLDVALEATTGWRFVVEVIRVVGGRAHLAEPAETGARSRSQLPWP